MNFRDVTNCQGRVEKIKIAHWVLMLCDMDQCSSAQSDPSLPNIGGNTTVEIDVLQDSGGRTLYVRRPDKHLIMCGGEDASGHEPACRCFCFISAGADD